MSDTGPQVDLQDPLPESSWFWRRIFVFTVTAAVLWMLWGAIDRLGSVAKVTPEEGVPALLALCKWIISFTGMMVTYYMVAPSAEQITKMVKTAALLRSGVQVSGRQTVETPNRTTDTAKTVGLPPAPPVPGPGAPIPAPDAPTPASDDDGPPWASSPPPQRGD